MSTMADYRKTMRRVAALFGELPEKAIYEREILLNAMAYEHDVSYDRAASPDFNARLNEEGEACLKNLRMLACARKRNTAAFAA